MVSSNHCQIPIILLVVFVLSIEIRLSLSAVRNITESHGPLFVQCPPPRIINASAHVTRVWWNTPAVHHHLVRSLRRTGLPPGSLFQEGSHSVVYEAQGFDGTTSSCEIIFTINVHQCQEIPLIRPMYIRCSNNNMVNSRCNFYCPPRYQLIGSSSVTCRESGEWSGKFPICRPVRNSTENHGPLFVECPPPRIINASTHVTRVWWNAPAVHHHLVRWLRRTGLPPGSLFQEGRHSVVYEARGFDGTTSSCEIIFTINVHQCQEIPLIRPMYMRCSKNIMVHSRCNFYCPPRYQLVGSSSVTCRESGEWSGTFPICRLVVCDSPAAPEHGIMRCSFPPNRQGSWCQFHCVHGYKMIGSSVRTCLMNDWSGVQPSCKDSRAPSFVYCPRPIRVRSEDGRTSAMVEYLEPMAIDNSNVNTELMSGQPSGERFALGVTRIHYRAEDESGNVAHCTFYIHVYDNEPPQFDFCPSPIHVFSTTLSPATAVTYKTPNATDNASLDSVVVTRIFGAESGSIFSPGVHAIHYRATDEAGNRAYCNFYIVLKVSPCNHLAEKDGLQMNCSEHLYHPESWCTFNCEKGFMLFGSATRICEKTGWSGEEAICVADTSLTTGGTETISKDERLTPTPLETPVTSSGELETEIITSYVNEHEA